MERLEREPCPYRLVDDAGGAFMFGKYHFESIMHL